MNKQEFLKTLQEQLSGLPEKDLQDRLSFYSEIIDDQMEEGRSEEDAVRNIGSAEDIAAQIIEETPMMKIVKEKISPKRKMRTWEIVLLMLGSPIWLSLLIAAFAVILSVYASAWAVTVSLWAVFISFVSCAFSTLAAGTVFLFCSNALSGLLFISASCICAGFSIFSFCGCKAITKEILLLQKHVVLKIKNNFIKKEKAV